MCADVLQGCKDHDPRTVTNARWPSDTQQQVEAVVALAAFLNVRREDLAHAARRRQVRRRIRERRFLREQTIR
ncbi:hypothetical protein ACQEU8_07270 [Streptomyces sp. CA-250714]|uniref:hypothetical protein n=1 Tax=Streptomyces sp. CA-250714 TaxID=3240060 RepID=UPI003D8A90C0